ncbi:MAG: hypothetical protein Q9163_004209 [Psora crenata]
MVHFASATLLGLALLALGASGAPQDAQVSDKLITYDDIKNAEPVIPDVTDPEKKSLGGDTNDNSTLLQARPDLAGVVSEAENIIPGLLADDAAPKPAGKLAVRDLLKRSDDVTCDIFTNKKNKGIQATKAALALAAQKTCKLWFPTNAIYLVPENSFRKATWFNALVLEYHVRDTTCTPYKKPIHEYYTTSQAVCIAQFTRLFKLAETVCAGDYSGVSSQVDKSVPIWYRWYTT